MTRALLVSGLAMLIITPEALAQSTGGSITDTSIRIPTAEELLRVLSLRDYNTRVVVIGTMLLGLAAGTIGSFMLLRKRALMGDALSHATLPGIGIAFMIATALGMDAKSLPVLLAGAVVTGVAGVLCILLIRNYTRIKEDAALGIVLSVFFGLGVAVLGVIQKMRTGSAAGLESFIYGKTASMLSSDAWLIGIAAAAVAGACVLLFKEFTLLCFDGAYARTEGWPIAWLDLAMMTMVVAVTVIGLQAVGLILIIALLIIPPAAARFWTDRLSTMILASAAIGAASGLFGAALSALVPRLPAGAIIVVVATTIFLISMIFGPARGVLIRYSEHRRLSRKVSRQHLLRAIYETAEGDGADPMTIGVPVEELMLMRSWSAVGLRRALRAAERAGLLYEGSDGNYRLTDDGLVEATTAVRNHRLWEAYLVTHADIAPSHVDRDADQIEHVLGRQMVKKLEAVVATEHPEMLVPPSPHAIGVKEPQMNADELR
ncbi:MAG TPA: iron chelate uptake ABC transporter family permease subunit [Tepidisphaeraceae bacterium]|nr:iron chelate uptake ABC transporter family permease subunit [Tepidisphaeraceae bacterium]